MQYIILPLLLMAQVEKSETLRQKFESITLEEVKAYTSVMISPEFEGRLSGSAGFWKTANWIADSLKSWGIQPAGDNGSFFQVFPNPYTWITNPGRLSITGDRQQGRRRYHFPDDFYPGSNSASGRVRGELVYVGFGISAPDLGFDEYAGVDVEGKIVVFEQGLPVQPNHPNFADWVHYSHHKTKLAIAKEKGAKGLLYIDKLANTNTQFQEGFIYAHITPEVTADLFYGTGTTLEQQRNKIIAELQPQSFYMNKTADLFIRSRHFPQATAANVVGIIEGSDPVLKNEVVIVGAHFDGQGMMGDLLFPSALDNASGTANIMAAARAIARSGVRPKRTIMFLFIGGHENGMYGTAHFIRNNPFPKEKTVFYLNLDMVGNGPGIGLWGGQSFPKVNRHFERNNTLFVGRNFVNSPSRMPVGRPRSDGAIFQLAGYTAMSMGTPGRTGDIYYHHHRDNMDNLTPDIMRDVARLLFLSLIDVANDTEITVPLKAQ